MILDKELIFSEGQSLSAAGAFSAVVGQGAGRAAGQGAGLSNRSAMAREVSLSASITL